MLRRIRPHLTYANVVATLALVVAIGGGTAYAASKIGTKQIAYHAVTGGKIDFNAVSSAKIKNATIRGKDIRDGGVKSADVRNGSLRAIDFAAGELPQGPKGDPGPGIADVRGTVAAGGGLTAGAGVTAVSTGPDGSYAVTVDKDVSACTIVATLATTDDPGSVAAAATGAQTIAVRTRDGSGAAAARPFAFAVFC
jgi:hypothetical protein